MQPTTITGAWARFGGAILRVVLVLECLISVGFVLAPLSGLVAQRWVQDDAYVSFRYAKNLVNGNGLVYNVGDRVEGYTNFLWTMLSAVPLAFGVQDPLPFMHGAGVVLWLASYALLIAIGVRLFHRGLWLGPLFIVPLTFHHSFNMWFVSAMETPLVSFFTIAALFAFTFDARQNPRALLWVSFLCVLLLMSRPDAVFFFAGIVLAGALVYGQDLLRRRNLRTYLGLPLVPILLIFLPYTLWRIWYYGSFYPNTYYVKVAYLTYYTQGWEYLKTYFRVYPLIWSVPLAVLGALLARDDLVRRFLLGSVISTALVFFYVVRLGGDFMEWRFVTPVTGVLYPAIIAGTAVCAGRVIAFFFKLSVTWTHAGGATVAAACTALLSFQTHASTPRLTELLITGQESIDLLARYYDSAQYNWVAAGKTFAEVFPNNIKIATSSAGIIPFFFDRPCLDLCGLTDPELARRPVNPNNRGRLGHEHCLETYEYAAQRGVDLYLHWVDPQPFPLIHLGRVPEQYQLLSVKLPDGRYTDVVLLNKSKVNLEAWRKDPRLVFPDSAGIAQPELFHSLAGQFDDYIVVDVIDTEEHPSHYAHLVQWHGPRYDYHAKRLAYGSNPDLQLFDRGFQFFDVRWSAYNISAAKDLVLIFRYDQVNSATYKLSVNGRELPEVIRFPGGAKESWAEKAVVVPASLLTDGLNEFHMNLATEMKDAAEIYRIWFLQKRDPGQADIGSHTDLALGRVRLPNQAHVLSDKTKLYMNLEARSHFEIIGELDLENAASQAKAEFRHEGPRDYHTKVARYRHPHGDVILSDDGLHIFKATWKVRNVKADRDLMVLIRYDRGRHAEYKMVVNGKPLEGDIAFVGAMFEEWDEVPVTIPASYLKNGDNEIVLHIPEGSNRVAELFYMWFLQPKA